ncbi:T9SS type A sorting domain-containing protein [Winogradskyella vidalii]|uniref:T9SS type A sorting domain-containing protein n=1 Tax=Winogradskyella vidalii TaxID=2615024 RepID=UPI0015C6BAA6|nr:aryl-sulfate sulfotransferase [Winogradskyella vidalii]
MKYTILLLFLIFMNATIAQETVGLVYDDINEPKSDGYTLFKPTSDNRVFLINNCGEVVNQWNFSGLNGNNAYLLENGNLLQSNDAYAEIRDWNNTILWSISYSTLGFTIHHDIAPMPNGNFLVMVRDVYYKNEMLAEGINTSYSDDKLQLERVIEIEPVGSDAANIVWEWKLFNHLVQDFDSSKPNYGTVANNPQLLDMNYDGGYGFNPIHANGIDYNKDLDQIAISARNLNEVFIIDHSTTTAEAATHSGGIYGKGGDFLWRWGNPEVYDNGTIADKKLGSQHDIKWITEGPNQGKMSVFNNLGYGNNLNASSVHILDQNDENGVYHLNSGRFLPESYFWSWDGSIMNLVMLGGKKCGVQIMSNGNALINESDKGRITEVDSSGNIVWVYMIPVSDNSNFEQFTQPSVNGAFRATRYPENYNGFNNITFNNNGIIENENTISENCISLLGNTSSYFNNLRVYPNPTNDILNFDFEKQLSQIEVYDLSGKHVLSKSNSKFINLKNLEDGLYIIKLSVDEYSEFIKITKK